MAYQIHLQSEMNIPLVEGRSLSLLVA